MNLFESLQHLKEENNNCIKYGQTLDNLSIDGDSNIYDEFEESLKLIEAANNHYKSALSNVDESIKRLKELKAKFKANKDNCNDACAIAMNSVYNHIMEQTKEIYDEFKIEEKEQEEDENKLNEAEEIDNYDDFEDDIYWGSDESLSDGYQAGLRETNIIEDTEDKKAWQYKGFKMVWKEDKIHNPGYFRWIIYKRDDRDCPWEEEFEGETKQICKDFIDSY